MVRRRRNKSTRLERKIDKKLSVFPFDFPESLLRKIHEVHLVYDHDDLLDAEQAEQIGVPAALLTHPFAGGDDQNCSISSRCARDHVFQELFVAGRVDDGVLAARRPKRNLRGVDRDVLFLLLEQRVEQKRKFKFHPFRRTRLLHHLDLPFRKRVRVLQNPADQRGLAVVNVTDKNNLYRQLWIVDCGLRTQFTNSVLIALYVVVRF